VVEEVALATVSRSLMPARSASLVAVGRTDDVVARRRLVAVLGRAPARVSGGLRCSLWLRLRRDDEGKAAVVGRRWAVVEEVALATVTRPPPSVEEVALAVLTGEVGHAVDG